MIKAELTSTGSGRLAAKMESTENIKRFILGGKAFFTLVSLKTGARFTFKVRTPKENPNFRNATPVYFVSVLTGSDNTGSYTYAGMLKGLRLQQTAKSKIHPETPSYKAIDWYIRNIFADRDVTESVEFWHAGKCGRCGRMLTVPSSIELGLGPECAGKGI